jgi:hypothetical protein
MHRTEVLAEAVSIDGALRFFFLVNEELFDVVAEAAELEERWFEYDDGM